MTIKSIVQPIGGEDRQILSEVVPLSSPFTLNVFPTNVCNFKCNYCIQSLDRQTLRQNYDLAMDTMSIDTFKQIVAQAKAFNSQFKLLSFMGHGEPMCNMHIEEMVKIAKESGCFERIEIITNGSLLTHERSLNLVKNGLDVIRISLQGLDSEQYHLTSGIQIDFEAFKNEVKFLFDNRKQCKVYVKVPNTCLGDNSEEVFYKLFESISDRMYVERIMPVYEGVDYGVSQLNLVVDRYGDTHKPRLVCPLCFYMLSVWPNGDIQPCDAFNRPIKLGNINQMSLLEAWQSDALKAFRIEQLNFKRKTLKGCDTCCAPDDVSRKQDELDDFALNILERI